MGENNITGHLINNYFINLNLQEELRQYIKNALHNHRHKAGLLKVFNDIKTSKLDHQEWEIKLNKILGKLELNLTAGIQHFLKEKLFSSEMRSVGEFVFFALQISELLSGIEIQYRGEAKYYDPTPCIAPIFRIFPEGNIEYELNEIEYFKKTKIGKKLNEKLVDNDIKWMYMTQHHSESLKELKNNQDYWQKQLYFEKRFNEENNLTGENKIKLNPKDKKNFFTRLLDLSQSPLIALFFACNNYNGISKSVKDGFVYFWYGLHNTPIEARPYGFYRSTDKRYQYDRYPYTTYQEHLNDAQGQYDIERLMEFDIENIGRYYEETVIIKSLEKLIIFTLIQR